jgi:hypothetical protein
VAGLLGKVGKQVKFQNPQDLRQALTIALTVTEALKQEIWPRLSTQNSRSRLGFQTGRTTGKLPEGIARGARVTTRKQGADRSGTTSSTRDVQHRSEPRCTECEERGHLARECPTWQKRKRTQNAPGRKNPSERSNRSRSLGDEPLHTSEKGTNNVTNNQGNE